MPALTDFLGNPVTPDDASSVAAIDAFTQGFLACELRVLDILPAAQHDHSAIVQTLAGMLHLFAEDPTGAPNAQPYLQRARAAADRASPREQRLLAAVQAWADGHMPQALALHAEQAAQHPRDLASVKLGQYHHFNLGDARGMHHLAQAVLPHAGDVPWLHGMAAFAWEQFHELEQAEREARTALVMIDREPWAQHAIAHVTLTQGRIDEGLAFMREASAGWTGLNSFMYTHNWWHVGLFHLERGETAAALALYDQHLWGSPAGAPGYTQDQIGAVSMLARIELAGGDVGARWQALVPYLTLRTADHVQPFLDMQYLYGLARAGRPEADTLMANIRHHAAHAPPWSRAAWQEVCLPACTALLAHARGQWADAITHMQQALPRLVEIGGSHAQRDLFERVLVDARARAR